MDEETGFGVTEMEEGMRDGIVLAKLARAFQGESVVKRIWTVSSLFVGTSKFDILSRTASIDTNKQTTSISSFDS